MSWLGEISFDFTIKYHLLTSAYYVHDGDRNDEVNSNMKRCSCRIFDLDMFPCDHALASTRVKGVTINNFVSQNSHTSMVIVCDDSIHLMG